MAPTKIDPVYISLTSDRIKLLNNALIWSVKCYFLQGSSDETLVFVVFIVECLKGFYGKNCVESCGQNCLSCNAVNGFCDTGCRPGWKGIFCEKSMF